MHAYIASDLNLPNLMIFQSHFTDSCGRSLETPGSAGFGAPAFAGFEMDRLVAQLADILNCGPNRDTGSLPAV